MKSHTTAPCLILPLVGILLILATGGCGLVDITAKLDLVRVTEVSLESATMEIFVTVKNPSAMGIALDNLAVNLSMAGSPLLKIVKEGPIDIDAHSSNHFVFPVTVRFDRLYHLYAKAKDKTEVAFAADGIVRVKTAVGNPTLYFTVSGTMPILSPPNISVDSWRVRDLDVKHALFDVTLKIENVSGKEPIITNLVYTIGFKNTNLVNKKEEEVALLRPGQVLLITIPTEVDIAAIRKSGFDEIVLEKVAQIKMRDLATIGVAFGDGPTGLSRFARHAIDTLLTAGKAKEFEARLPFLQPALAAVEAAALLHLTNGSAKMSEPQPDATVPRKASFFENSWVSIVLLLFCFPAGLVLMWVKAPWKTRTKIATTVVLGLMFGLTFIMVFAAGPRPNEPPSAGAAVQTDPGPVETPEAVAPPEPRIPRPDFVRERLETCAQYKQAPNDIKRSEIYTDYFKQTALKPFQVKDMAGVLRKMATSRGGGIVLLTVETEVGVFGNNDMMQGGFLESRREIRKASKLYHRIGDLTEGQRVTFSGELIIAEKETTEKMSLCGDSWLIKFTDIKAAQ